jgi:hypothetical protein
MANVTPEGLPHVAPIGSRCFASRGALSTSNMPPAGLSMWARMRAVHDVYFSRVEGIRLGAMTRECWRPLDDSALEPGRGQKVPPSEYRADNSSFDSVANGASPRNLVRAGTVLSTCNHSTAKRQCSPRSWE